MSNWTYSSYSNDSNNWEGGSGCLTTRQDWKNTDQYPKSSQSFDIKEPCQTQNSWEKNPDRHTGSKWSAFKEPQKNKVNQTETNWGHNSEYAASAHQNQNNSYKQNQQSTSVWRTYNQSHETMNEVNVNITDSTYGSFNKETYPANQEDNHQINLFSNKPAIRIKLQDIINESSLLSAKNFTDLNLKQELLKGLYTMGFSKPSKIQERVLPPLLAYPPKNIICQSQSGSGKSVAFCIAMLQKIDINLKAPQVICLAPTRELARQLISVMDSMGRFMGVTKALVIKDSSIRNHHITDQVIIGTPGTLLFSLRRGFIDNTHLKTFVLDEADNMLEREGLGDQSIRVKRMLNINNTQIMLFSATFPDRVLKFATDFAPDANEILLHNVKELNVERISQVYMDCKGENHKYEVLCNLYDFLTVSQSIIFCKKRQSADEISARMIEQGHNVKCLHAGLTPEERDQIIDEFRHGEFKVLISTNVVSRGIDICQVSLVINYDMPLTKFKKPDVEAYLHRIGRTGRFGRNGLSICFAYDHASWEEIKYVESYFNTAIKRVPTDDWETVQNIFKDVIY